MKKILGIVVVAVLAIGAVSMFAPQLLGLGGNGSPASATSPVGSFHLLAEKGADAAKDAKNNALNGVIDASGVKQTIDATLRSYEGEIASYIGMDPGYIDSAIDSMAINQWEVANLPSTATPATNIPIEYAGTSASLTTYDDPGYVSLEAYGQTVTLAVPESAQESMQLLNYVGYLG